MYIHRYCQHQQGMYQYKLWMEWYMYLIENFMLCINVQMLYKVTTMNKLSFDWYWLFVCGVLLLGGSIMIATFTVFYHFSFFRLFFLLFFVVFWNVTLSSIWNWKVIFSFFLFIPCISFIVFFASFFCKFFRLMRLMLLCCL